MTKTWLWLDDQPETIEDFQVDLKNAGVATKLFRNPDILLDFLIKEKERGNLDKYGLILDILLMGVQYITLPKEWSKKQKDEYYPTERSYNAGVLFCEKVIMNISQHKLDPYWYPPPPIIFLTVLHTNYPQTKQRFIKIRDVWSQAHRVSIENAKVNWVEKFKTNGNHLIEIIKNAEE